ncbi:MAG: hypothetical protein V1744_00110 [Candidatus Altiarchaeota archaeon]
MKPGELKFLAKYPFLKRTREYVSSLNLSFEDVLKHPIYSAALELGVGRVRDCLERKFKPELEEDRLDLVILSYPLARMIAHSVSQSVASKYADGEAEAAYAMMEGEMGEAFSEIAEDLGVKGGSMPFLQYTRLASSLSRHNPKWKLVNRVVERGIIEVEAEEARTLLREAVKHRVLEPVDLKKVPQEVKREAANLKTALTGEKATIKVENLEDDALPSCIKSITAAMENGIASHNGMFILATFLANLGLKKEDINAVFARSPKYDEEKTLYQLGFIRGERGVTEYTCPTCATIKSHGLCKAECNVKHPLQYYRQHARRKPKVIKR